MKRKLTEYITYEYKVVFFKRLPDIEDRYYQTFLRIPHREDERRFYTYEEALKYFSKAIDVEYEEDIYRIELRRVDDNKLLRWAE